LTTFTKSNKRYYGTTMVFLKPSVSIKLPVNLGSPKIL